MFEKRREEKRKEEKTKMSNNAPHNALTQAINRAIAEDAPVYTEQPAVTIGRRVEIAPHFDLWMRGARTGVVRSINANGIAKVKMDHPQVKRLARIPVEDLKPVH